MYSVCPAATDGIDAEGRPTETADSWRHRLEMLNTQKPFRQGAPPVLGLRDRSLLG